VAAPENGTLVSNVALMKEHSFGGHIPEWGVIRPGCERTGRKRL
jgi:hypothetical protein